MEGHTDEMARAVHRGWKQSCRARRVEGSPPKPAAAAVINSRLPPMVQPPRVDGKKLIAVPVVPEPKRPQRFPRMPLKPGPVQQEHRPKTGSPWPMFSAVVAKSISKKERDLIPEAKEAMLKESNKLAVNKVWDLDSVMSLHDAKKRAGAKLKIHVARVFGFCVLKGSE